MITPVRAARFAVKATSLRTGRVSWARADGGPTSHFSEAGFFARDLAEHTAAEWSRHVTAGRWDFDLEIVSI